MSAFFKDYHTAHDQAQTKANATGCSYGIEGALEFGTRGYTVKMLPRPENRQGFELRCEVVDPERCAT